MTKSDPAVILVEGYIQAPVKLVLNGPMLADRIQELLATTRGVVVYFGVDGMRGGTMPLAIC